MGAVAGPTTGNHSPADRPLVLSHHCQTGRLGHHSQHREAPQHVGPDEVCGWTVSWQSGIGSPREKQSGERVGPGKPELLIHAGHENDRSPPFHGSLQPLKGSHHRGHPPLYVAGPAAGQPAIPHGWGEGLDDHAGNWHGVLMHIPNQHRSVRHGCWEASDHIVTPGRDWLSDRRNSGRFQPPQQVVGHAALEILRANEIPAHRVDAGSPYQISKNCGGIGHRRHGSR